MRVHTFTALSVATVPVPASVDGHHPAERHLASIGLFTAVITGNRWRFYTNGAAIGAAQPEWLLLRWLHDNLPEPASLIGYQLDSHVLAALTSAAATAPAETAHRSMTSLATALRTGAIDVALDWGGALAPPLVDIAADHGIGTSITTDEQRASHWRSATWTSCARTRPTRRSACGGCSCAWRPSAVCMQRPRPKTGCSDGVACAASRGDEQE